MLSGDEDTAEFFEAVLSSYDSPTTVAPWMVNEVLHRIGDGATIGDLSLDAEHAASLVEMVDDDRITTQVSRQVLETVLETGEDPEEIVAREGLEKMGAASELEPIIDDIVESHPDEVERYRGGNQRLIGFFIGQVMQATGGAADAVKVRQLLQDKLAQ